MFSLPSDMLQVSWGGFHVQFGFEILSFLPSTCIFLWAKKSCFIPYLRIKLYFLTGYQQRQRRSSGFVIVIDLFLLSTKSYFKILWAGRRRWMNFESGSTNAKTLQLLKWAFGDKLPSPVPACSHCSWWQNMGYQQDTGCLSIYRSLFFTGMWRQHALGDPAKGIWVRPCDQGPLPLSHFSHTADHISLGQKPDKCVQAILGRRAHTRGCPFHPQILHKVFPAWFPKTSSSVLASGNSSW